MTAGWIIIESLAVLAESLAKVYFINSQLPKKFSPRSFFLPFLFSLTAWGAIGTFALINQMAYDAVDILIYFSFVFTLTRASAARKIFVIFLTIAVSFASTLSGAYILNLVLKTTIDHTLQNQDMSRMFTVIFIKVIEVAVFALISKKQLFRSGAGRAPMLVLTAGSILCLAAEFLLWFYISAGSGGLNADDFLAAVSACVLLVLVAGFAMYDIFARLERRNTELADRLRRSDMEMTFREEVKNMHLDLQKWRHEYKNDIIALRGYLGEGDLSGASAYVDKLADAPFAARPLIITNNHALDAVINSKLWLASTRGIAVSAQSAFPEDGVLRVSDGDLCSIAGNLLDNSIEACDRIKGPERKFLTLELLVKGHNLFLMVYNSYAGEILRDGDVFVSSKGSPRNGMGLKYVDSIIDKYEGYAKRGYGNGVFSTQVMIPLLEPDGGRYRAKDVRRIIDGFMGF
jgi:hypothetical protein